MIVAAVAMETESADHPIFSSNVVDDSTLPNDGDTEKRPEIDEKDDCGRILEIIASTGKFWHDWEKLKGVLSFQLKQVLSEYPEANMAVEDQNASLGETFFDLMKRLDEALNSFDEGPPFTLQRLCEILLGARSIYPNLSKLALALEKNLLVTSMLNICTDPYPQVIQKPDNIEKDNKESHQQPNPTQNGVESTVVDGDEEMTEVGEADGENDMTIHMDALEEMVGSSETNSATAENP
ncbi:hypothetical protein K2173_025618 [Erythroxylum novogranatense]|uniref:Serine/threonine-protein phosphatase 4 regulatory subunit 2 n=1 Tax=Erythroxylum novogranatense TaxID=1862640 RepID=A0AAV8SMZ0_9ROSI|nr:hypothetical protein K2173_025618 [Erythroxylum novogranatense]